MDQRRIRFVILLAAIAPISLSNPLSNEDATAKNAYECAPEAISLASNNLGFSIAKSIGNNKNTFFSPLSLSMALGMAYLGAAGDTAIQMEDALSYRSSNIRGNQVHQGIKELSEGIREKANNYGYDLTISNGLFYNNETVIKSEFMTGMHSYYHADTLPADFAHKPAETTKLINDWVREKTSNKIPTLFNDPLPAETQAILTNAIYFKGTWKIEFPEKRSFDGHFINNNNLQGKPVRMMSLADETFPYLKDELTGYKYLEMPYKGEKISMLFALPLKHDQNPDLEMNNDLLCRIRNEMVDTKLEDIVIPRFKFAYEKQMKETMMSLGMTDAFGPGADFSSMSSSSTYISEVLHKAIIEVNEKGSEAAAVTGIKVVLVSLRDTTEFVADHPFQFYIIDKESGVVIFSGTVMDPSAS